MLIKKFSANTETDAMLLAKEELGKQAIIMNIKHIKPKGIHRLFKKDLVEVTAAVDEPIVSIPVVNEPNYEPTYNEAIIRGDIMAETNAIETKLDTLQTMLEEQMSKRTKKVEEVVSVFDIPCVKLICDQLVENELTKENAELIIREVEQRIDKDSTIDQVLSHVYQKIVLKLGQPKQIELKKDSTKFIFFMGPTGVGKTTTIAKIASTLKLQNKVKIALVTLDTYRIAAVEQLRTYANILNMPLKVVYSNEELAEIKDEFKDYDLVLIDTAGRSHKNDIQVDDMKQLLGEIPEERKEVYLVLSATTKYKDMLQIVKVYEQFSDFNLIFTKLDETMAVGNILNLRLLTNASLSYTTWGQNVPDDIGKLNPQKIAKQLLGGND